MYKGILKTVYKVSDFLSWQRSSSLVLSPSFQRRSVWPKGAKSLLVDTVVQGIPMPIIFLREKTDLKTLEPIREVVDGQQRLRTLISFIEPVLIKDLADFDENKDLFCMQPTHNEELAGKSFRELPRQIRKQILNYEFSVHVLPSDTEDRDVLQIFARMNSTGVKLNHQELRNAEYYGVFKTLMYNLALEQLGRWRDWRVFNENEIARMFEVEQTSELTRLMLEGLQGKNQRALNRLYGEHEESFEHGLVVTQRFHQVMDKIDETVGRDLGASAFSKKGLFETLFAFYYDLQYGLGSPLKRAKANPLPRRAVKTVRRASDIVLHGELPENLAKVLRGGTGNKESREVRLKFLREIYNRVKN